jgi:dienelactone hydrolase
MYPHAADLWLAGARGGLAVAQARYGARGWEGGDRAADVRSALEALAGRHPGVPVCLVGHSMGARASLRTADHPAVVAVAALAAWVPDGEPVAQLAGRTVMLAHGTRDRTTDPAATARYARRAREHASAVALFEVGGGDHAMLARAPAWHRMTRRFVLAALGLAPPDATLRRALSPAGIPAVPL